MVVCGAGRVPPYSMLARSRTHRCDSTTPFDTPVVPLV